MQAGDVLSGSVAVRQSKENYRELDVKFSYHFKTQGPQIPAQVQLYKVRWKYEGRVIYSILSN